MATYLSSDGVGDYALSDYTTAITGDLDVRAYIRATDWERDAGDGYQILACQGGWSDANWWLSLRYGKIVFVMGNTAGSWTYAVLTDSALTEMDGVDVWVRATHDVNNGAGGNTVEIYRSANGIDWTNLPSAGEPSGTYTRYNSTTAHMVGRLGPGADYGCFQGRIYEVQIRSGIDGTLVANPKFSAAPWVSGDPSGTARDDAQGNTWTLTNAVIAGVADAPAPASWGMQVSG